MKSRKFIITSENLIVFGLSLLCMYAMNPFYFSSIESINKALYYGFVIIVFMAITFSTGIFRIEKLIYDQVMYFGFYIVCIMCVMVINRSTDMSYLIYLIRLIFGILSTYVVYLLWKVQYQKGKISISLMEVYIMANVIYIFSTILMVAFPMFREVWLSLISSYGREVYLSRTEYITRVGVAGFAGFGVSIQVICALITLIFLSELRKITSLRRNVYYIILLIGSFCYGRISLILFVCITLLWLGYYVFIRANANVLLMSVFCITLIGISGLIFVDKISNSDSDYWKWILEPIVNYHLSDKFSSDSLTALLHGYQSFSYSSDIYFRGTARFVELDGSYSVGSDSGLLQKVYFGGILYAVILYGLIIRGFNRLCRFIKQEAKNAYKFLMFVFINSFIICELKGDVIFFFLKIIMLMHLGLQCEKQINSK